MHSVRDSQAVLCPTRRPGLVLDLMHIGTGVIEERGLQHCTETDSLHMFTTFLQSQHPDYQA